MTLIAILAGTLAAGVVSVWIAAALSFGALARYTRHMLSLAAGALLATAFINLLPEAFESHSSPQALFGTLLAGLVFFFVLDKAQMWHHSHEHHASLPTLDQAMDEVHQHRPDGPTHDHDHEDHAQGRRGVWAVLTGDSLHCFGDGVLIASTFMAGLSLGAVASLAVLVHEVPHHMGDLAVLRSGEAGNRRLALIKVSLAGAMTCLGGLVGYLLLGQLNNLLPWLIVLASSSFVYVALADLIPQLQAHTGSRATVMQILWLACGMALVIGVGHFVHDV
ncbi:MAG: ZIP family metal transporter [Burkholderiaceae bacterium]|jgi:zinc and cadmium transporter|nr:ZIP family metal transporter [Burkholderiaceae bacterium]